MPQVSTPTARTALRKHLKRVCVGRPAWWAALLLTAVVPAVVTGCDAIYDDTKGWASRLEASILESAHEVAEPDADEAPGDAAPTMAEVKPQEMAPPPAVPVTPVATTALAAPEASEAPEATAQAATAAPDGAMAAASAALLAHRADAPAPAAEPAAAAKTAALPPLPKPKPNDDPVVSVVLHLSSLRSEEAAKRQWSDLQHRFPEPLGQLQAAFSRTELGDKGTFYRVLAGPLPSRDEAAEVCAALKTKNDRQYCRVLPAQPKG